MFYNNKRRDIDIVIEIYNETFEEPLYTLCIENKINDSSIQKKQLMEEVNGLKNEYKDNNWSTEIYFCFITLEDSKKSNIEFEEFKYDKKIHLYWKGIQSIQQKVLNILELERLGEIDPISEDIKFLLKSFLSFIKTDFKSSLEEKDEKQQRKSYGKTVIEYFREFVRTMENDKDYEISEIKKIISEMIKKESGVSVNKSTLRCHVEATIVNERNRLHHYITERDLFLYPDENNKKIIRKYSPEMKDVNIYLK